MDIKNLKRIYNLGLINLSGVCKRAKLNNNTMLAKILNDRELKVNESKAIDKALQPIIEAIKN